MSASEARLAFGARDGVMYAPLLVCALLMMVGFGHTIIGFPEAWNEDRTHGYAVAAFCLWMLWRARGEFQGSDELRVPAALVAFGLSVGWLLAHVAGIRVGEQLLLLLLVVAWAGASFGSGGLRRFATIGSVFILAVPVWEVLLGVLQFLTVMVNSAAVRALDIPAKVSGNQIHFSSGIVEIAQSCAGLSYFMSALTIGVVYGHLFLRTWRDRLEVAGIAVVLAIVSNWIRVFGLVLIGYYSEMKSPLMREHATYGWVIFAIVMVAFFVVVAWRERSAQWQVAGSSMPVARDSTPGHVAWRDIGMPTAIALSGPVLFWGFTLVREVAPAPLNPPGTSINASWVRSSPRDTMMWSPAYRGQSERRVLALTRDGRTVQVDRFLFAQQQQGAELINGNNRIAEEVLEERIVGPLDDRLRTVQQAVVRTPSGVRIVWYWYSVAGVETASAARAKLLEIPAFVLRSPPAELIAVSTPCDAGSCTDALPALFEVSTGRPFPENQRR